MLLSDLKKMKVAELREELEVRGLDSKGTKPVLIQRLEEALANSQEEDDDDGGAEVGDDEGAEVEADLEESVEESFQSATESAEVETAEEADESVLDNVSNEPEHSINVNEAEVVDEVGEDEEEEMGKEIVAEEDIAETERQMDTVEDVSAVEEGHVKNVEEEVHESHAEGEEVQEKENEEPKQEVEIKEESEVKEEEVNLDNGDVEWEVKDEVVEEDSKDRSRGEKRRHRSHSRSRSRDKRKSRDKERERTPPFAEEEEEDIDDNLVTLDWYNSDLNLVVQSGRLSAEPMTEEGFAFMWAGARATWGVNKGRVAYEVKLVKNMDVPHLPPDEEHKWVVRLGWSHGDTSLQLGEEPKSWGFGGTGKKSVDRKFLDYGKAFGEGDVVTVYIDLDSAPITMSFSKNGDDLGEAYSIEEKYDGAAFFPHVLTKNVSFECNFGDRAEGAHHALKDGYTFIQSIPQVDRVRSDKGPEKREECEIITMVGLPACGKSTWIHKYAKENPEKKYNILGTNDIIDKMRVEGLPRRRNYHGRWETLIKMSTNCLNKMLEVGSSRRRNVVIDQTNVYASARRRKLKAYKGFIRRAVVIVPTDDDFKKRKELQEKDEGKQVPEHAIMEMKANFTLPEEGELFHKVEFIELDAKEAAKLVDKYNYESRSATRGDREPAEKRFRDSRDYRGRGEYRGSRGGGYNSYRDRDDRYSGRSHERGSGFGGYRGGYRGARGADRGRDRGYSGSSSHTYRERERYHDKGKSGYGGSGGRSSYGGGASSYRADSYSSSRSVGSRSSYAPSSYAAPPQASYPAYGQQPPASGYGGYGGYNQYSQQYQQYASYYQPPPSSQYSGYNYGAYGGATGGTGGYGSSGYGGSSGYYRG